MKEKITLHCDGRSISTDEVSAAWLQQTPPEPFSIAFNSPEARQYETFYHLYSYACHRIEAPWLNHPRNVLRAANKAFQYQGARQIGLHIPDTLVSNDSSEVRTFFRQHNGLVVIKNLATPWYVTKGGKTKAAYTKLLTPEMLSNASDIEYSPLIYQRYIQRKADIRAVIIGTNIFSGLTMAYTKETLYDIRRVDLRKIKYAPIKLPPLTKKKLLELMEFFQLQYASVDLILDRKDNLYFLDLNATGAFFWLEELTSLPISDAITDFLSLLRAGALRKRRGEEMLNKIQ